MKRRYETCEARMQDEFPGYKGGDGKLVVGNITQLELYDPYDSSEVVAWFLDPELAEQVARLLNKAAKKSKPVIRVVVSKLGLKRHRAMEALAKGQAKALGIREPHGFYHGCKVVYGTLRKGKFTPHQEG